MHKRHKVAVLWQYTVSSKWLYRHLRAGNYVTRLLKRNVQCLFSARWQLCGRCQIDSCDARCVALWFWDNHTQTGCQQLVINFASTKYRSAVFFLCRDTENDVCENETYFISQFLNWCCVILFRCIHILSQKRTQELMEGCFHFLSPALPSPSYLPPFSPPLPFSSVPILFTTFLPSSLLPHPFPPSPPLISRASLNHLGGLDEMKADNASDAHYICKKATDSNHFEYSEMHCRLINI